MIQFFRWILFPFAIMYDLVTTIRNALYSAQILKSTSFQVPIISVGNLSVGGTGKTPQIEYLVRLLQEEKQLAILSRGYKRTSTGFLQVAAQHTAQEVGDEPLQYFKKFPTVQVAVDANRVHGVEALLLKNPAVDVVLLDDAFQHRKIKAGLSILLTSYASLYTADYVLPTGNLRESRSGAKRADIVVVTKCPASLSEAAQEQTIQQLQVASRQQVFFTQISYANSVRGTGIEIPVATLSSYKVLLVTGIANPLPLQEKLDSLGIVYTHVKYADHHAFSKKDCETIQQKFEEVAGQKKIILTTEKDHVRLSGKLTDLYFWEMTTMFLKDGALFDALVSNFTTH